MFEQDRLVGNERSKGVFRGDNGPGVGMRRYQVSGTGDSAEIAADRAADQAVGGLFRSAEGGASAGFQADLADSDLGGGGSPLPEDLMGSMERSLGGSFSGVRIHTDAGADRASRGIDARAFTRGQDIYFRQGSYAPDTPEGQHLIAHELAHVAAGDTGIHRDGGGTGNAPAAVQPAAPQKAPPAPPPRSSASLKENTEVTKEREKMKAAVAEAGKFKESGNVLLQKCGSAETLRAQALGGETNVLQLKEGLEGLDSGLTKRRQDVSDAMERYVKAWTDVGGTAEDAKKSDEYTAAEAMLQAIDTFKNDGVEKAKTAVTQVAGSASGTDVDKKNGPFSESVNEMLDDASCVQFFKAVEDVRKGAAGFDENARTGAVSGAEESARNARKTSTDERHVKELQETRHEANSRRSDNAGLGLAFTGLASDTLGFHADYLTAKHEDPDGKKEMAKGYEDTRLASGVIGAASAAADATNSTVGAVSSGKAVAAREKELERKRAELARLNPNSGIGKASVADHAGRSSAASKAVGAFGSTIGIGTSVAGAFKSNNETAGKWNNGMALAGSSVGMIGDALGMAADSGKARKARQRDLAAKASMRSLGKQLMATVPANSTTPRGIAIKAVCKRLEGDKFNAKGATRSLTDLITTAENTQFDDEASDKKQKALLASIKALEASRDASKGEASDARKDALFGAVGLAGSITGLVGNALKAAGLGKAGSIVGLVGSGISFVSKMLGFKNAKGKSGALEDKKNERDAKLDACGAAVRQMAGLPALKLDLLKNAKTNKEAQPAVVTEAAEQYAAVYHTIKAANVNMVDFLYAVEKGQFGGTSGSNNQPNTMESSLAAMYKELSFN